MKKLYITVVIPLTLVVLVLSIINLCNSSVGTVSQQTAALIVEVTDMQGNAVSNASIKVVEAESSIVADNNGKTQQLALSDDIFNGNDWVGITVVVQRSGYVPTVVSGCVVTKNNLRVLKVRMYLDDGTLPYVCYVECPPQSYIEQLLGLR